MDLSGRSGGIDGETSTPEAVTPRRGNGPPPRRGKMPGVSRSAAFWIEHLGLTPHPEGGHFRETYRAAERLSSTALPARYGGLRACSTAIYFLLRAGEVSALHRLKSDELWHFHAGGPLVVSVIDPGGARHDITLGPDPDAGQLFQATVPAGAWFGAALQSGTAYTLVGCTVAPGFEFADFELADRGALLWRYPQHAALIEHLTR
jgi:predicted cupin superfamily sugar epimerase